ncbi:MarR family winged helix-turn-helix transcriptional regulator [Telmatospirillum sp. J64-1]|uniref:MarR family winged helix-turn-helix transcriptional regulator n=1 Tax=Telmatospirillum sp. J64-1 TaxID=2502183 RepID=UPI00115EAC0A|nr:winged helix-turn-helix transcriptional regulator [Telmatospirillum sp. J64-1]
MDRKLRQAILVLEEFRKLDPELPIQIALILLLIAEKPGISNRELVQLTGLGKSSVARNVAILSKEHGKFGLVTYYEDPEDRRNKVAKLTPEGQRFINSIKHYFEAA